MKCTSCLQETIKYNKNKDCYICSNCNFYITTNECENIFYNNEKVLEEINIREKHYKYKDRYKDNQQIIIKKEND